MTYSEKSLRIVVQGAVLEGRTPEQMLKSYADHIAGHRQVIRESFRHRNSREKKFWRARCRKSIQEVRDLIVAEPAIRMLIKEYAS